MSGRVYTAEFENQTFVTAFGDYDLFQIMRSDTLPGPNHPYEIVGFNLSVLSELGGAEEEWLRLQIGRHYDTVSFATNFTPARLDEFDAAPVVEAWGLDAAVATGSGIENLWSDAWNIRTRYQRWFPRGGSPGVDASTGSISVLVLRLMGAVTDSLTMSGTIYYMES